MMWLTWRQHRSEAAIIAGVLVVLAVTMFMSHEVTTATAQQLGITTCFAHPEDGSSQCGLPFTTFLGQFGWEQLAATGLNLFPPLLGIFVGVPLVARELEGGTHRMIWVQGVSRLHWLIVKLAFVIGMCLLAAALLTALVSWWHTPFDQLEGSLQPSAFDLEGIALLAYTLFATSLGIAAGAFIRRTIPAMLATLGAFLALRLPVEFLLRPRYLPPIAATWDPSQPSAHSPTRGLTGSSPTASGWTRQATM